MPAVIYKNILNLSEFDAIKLSGPRNQTQLLASTPTVLKKNILNGPQDLGSRSKIDDFMPNFDFFSLTNF